MIVEQNTRTVLTVRFDVKAGWEKWMLLRTDAHHDNLYSNHELQKRHLEEAVERDAHIIDNGDLFCAMQGKWDRRADQSQLRPELQHKDYLDRLVKYNSDFIEPYANRFILIGQGNHETSILKHHETDLTSRLVERLNTRCPKAKVYAGGFTGWIRFLFTINGNQRTSRVMFRHHGYGGGGPVTRGVIQTARMAVYLPDADIVLTGHTHDEWAMTIQRDRLTQCGKQFQDEQLHIRPPGYKDEYADGYEGWHIERGAPPKPIGAVWLKFKCVSRNGVKTVETDWSRAK